MKNLLNEIELELLHTPETSILGKIKNIIFGATLYITWATLILLIYKTYIPEFKDIKLQFSWFSEPSQIYMFISSCILAPFMEELYFRTPMLFLKRMNIEKIILYYVIFSSAIFGYMHKGAWSIPVQGVAGILFCYVYLKNNYSYLSSVICHFLVNFYFFLK